MWKKNCFFSVSRSIRLWMCFISSFMFFRERLKNDESVVDVVVAAVDPVQPYTRVCLFNGNFIPIGEIHFSNFFSFFFFLFVFVHFFFLSFSVSSCRHSRHTCIATVTCNICTALSESLPICFIMNFFFNLTFWLAHGHTHTHTFVSIRIWKCTQSWMAIRI